MVHQVQSYLSHWLNAVGAHSLQAPFVYNLYTKVILNDANPKKFQAFKTLQKTLTHSDKVVESSLLGANSRVEEGSVHSVSKIARHGTSNARVSRLLYRLAVSNNADTIVELGTSLGVNTCYLSEVQDASVFTFEGAPQIAASAKTVFKEQNRKNIKIIEGNIDNTLPEFLNTIDQIDFAFVDANHRYDPTIKYFELLKTKAQQDAILIFDDIYWSKEMTKAWKNIIADDQVTLSLDLFDVGVVFINPDLAKQNFQLSF